MQPKTEHTPKARKFSYANMHRCTLALDSSIAAMEAALRFADDETERREASGLEGYIAEAANIADQLRAALKLSKGE